MRNLNSKGGTRLFLVSVITILYLSQAPLPLAGGKVLGDGWKQYRSAEAGFEVKYPQDWEVSVADKGGYYVVAFRSPGVFDEDIIQHATIRICSAPMNQTFPPGSDCQLRDSHLSGIAKDTVVSQQLIVINGTNVNRQVTKEQFDYGSGLVFHYARFYFNRKNVFMAGSFTKRFNLDRHIPVFDKILESFRPFSD